MTPQTESMLDKFIVLERCILYARVSGDDRGKEGRNLQGQLDMGREYATEKGYSIIAELPEDDRGASGANIDLPQLDRIREMARAGQFDVLIVRELDRLSRNLAKQLIVEDELKRYGVRIEYVLAEYDDTAEGRLQKHIRATVAEYEREKIKERMVRGKRNKVKTGKVLPSRHRPYGYVFADDTLVICEAEAQIVRLIFEWYVDEGLGVITIAKRLTEMGIPTYLAINPGLSSPQARKHTDRWSKSTVRDMLRNKTYIGQWVYGKRKSIKGGTKYNSPDYLLTVNVPAIIEPDVFKAAQEKLNDARKMSKRNTKYEYLMARHLTCGCSHAMIAITMNQNYKGKKYQYRYYRCNTQADKFQYPESECNAPTYSIDEIDSAVWQELEDTIHSDEKLKKGLRGYQAEMAESVNPLKQNLAMIEELIERHTNDLNDALANMKLVKGERAKAFIAQGIDQIEVVLNGLEAQREDLIKQIEGNALTDEQIEEILTFAAQMRQDWDVISQDPESRRKFIEWLNVRGVLKIEGDEKALYITAKLGNGPKRLILQSVDDKNQYAVHNLENSVIISARLIIGQAKG